MLMARVADSMPAAEGPRQSFFDIWSRFYDAPMVQQAIYRPVHEAVLKELARQRGGRIADVGCGTGILTVRLAGELGADTVCGFDFSLGMLEQASARQVGPWVQADAQRLPLPSESLDAVVSTESFHWFPDPDAALAEFHRVLAPGGRLVVGMVNVRTAAMARVVSTVSAVLGQPARWPTRARHEPPGRCRRVPRGPPTAGRPAGGDRDPDRPDGGRAGVSPIQAGVSRASARRRITWAIRTPAMARAASTMRRTSNCSMSTPRSARPIRRYRSSRPSPGQSGGWQLNAR